MSQSPPEGLGTDKQKTGNQEEQHPLQGNSEKGANQDNHLSTNATRKESAPCSFCKDTVLQLVHILLSIMTFITFVLAVALAVRVFRGHEPYQVCYGGAFHASELPLVVLSCPDGWVGYQRKCYYFSEAEGNWDYSRNICSALGASLAGIDSLQELAFLMRHKGPGIHWIGLWREGEGQPWKWANGTEFNNLFEVKGGADCAYLNNIGVSSSTCLMAMNWICSKPSLH